MTRISSGNPNGRPGKEIDWELVDKLLQAGCPGTEIAPHFDIHYETLYRRVQDEFGVGFTEYSQQKRSKGDSSLREEQFKRALKGNTTLLIWLGKQRLGQREHDKNDTIAPHDSHLEMIQQLIKENKELKDKLNATQPEANPIVSGSDQEI